MCKPIRVLHVFGALNRCGAETMIMNIYRNIDRSKVQFDFIVHTKEKCDYYDEIEELGGKIYCVSKYTGKNHFSYKNEWNNFFRNHNEYKIVHGHVRSTAAIYLKIAKDYGIVTISHSHSTSSGKGVQALIKNIMQYPIRYISDYLFACSLDAGKWLYGNNYCKSDKFYIVKNAVDINKYKFNEDIRRKVRREFNIDDKFVIGHVGRFHASKNHKFIIEIFNEVYKKNSNSILLLLGDGDLKETIMEKVKILGIEKNVIFTGNISNVNDFMQAMDIFLFPSLYEGLGIVAIEAQVSGVSCIVANSIPKETYITSLIKNLSLNQTANKWAEEILNLNKKYDRNREIENIKESGYDIIQTSKWIENFYVSKG